ncbi:MAG: BACON domain-containing protein [Bacteroidaceae bacterium]|nr:BACON domain-containing protein [Bacteroidaceae bacterium]
MKKSAFWNLLSILMLAIFGYGVSACSSDDDAPVPSLSVSNTSVFVEANGLMNDKIIVKAENTDWQLDVTAGRDWLNAYKNGNEVAIIAKENKEINDRGGIIIVTATEDSKLSYVINVTQRGAVPYLTVNGAENAEHSFPGLFDSNKSGIDYKQTFKIRSNIQWSLTGKVDWLNISPTTGNGEVELSIYPTSENSADQERRAVITLSGSDQLVTIDIVQGPGKPVCKVVPQNEVALYDRICWEYDATSNVVEFQWILLTALDYERLTNEELMYKIKQQNKLKFKDEYLSSASYDDNDNKITEETKYYLITLAYDKDEVEGEICKTVIRTPSYLDSDDDAWVNFENLSSDFATYFSFDTKKEGYCNTYHLIYGICDANYNKAFYAFEINYYLKYGKKHWLAEDWGMQIVTNYPNNHTFTYYSNDLVEEPYVFAYGWGVFKDETLSSDLIGFCIDTSEDEAKHRAVSNAEDVPGNITLVRSVEQEKARKMRK